MLSVSNFFILAKRETVSLRKVFFRFIESELDGSLSKTLAPIGRRLCFDIDAGARLARANCVPKSSDFNNF
jgi:hypothetical protein